MANDPDHPVYRFAEHFIRHYPANIIPYVLVLPERDWFPDGNVHRSVSAKT